MKKFLSLVLALVMTMSLVTVSAGAKDFNDAEDIQYVEAVEVLNLIGVIEGYPDGTFQPKTVLTRAQAATIIAKLLLTPEVAAELSASSAPFADVAANHWAAGYIAEGVDAGILSGMGDGTFAPDAQLTGNQFLKMLLCALGYDAEAEGMTGANWSNNVTKLVKKLKLTKGNDKFVGNAAVTREEAALYVFNAMDKATVTGYSNDGGVKITVGDVVIESVAGEAQPYGESLIETYGLEKMTDGEDDFCRAGIYWVYDDEETAVVYEAADYVLVAEQAFEDLAEMVEELELEDEIDAGTTLNKGIARGTVVELWLDGDDAVETYITYNYALDKIVDVEDEFDDESDEYEHAIGAIYTFEELDGLYVDSFDECDEKKCEICDEAIVIGEWEEDDMVMLTVNMDGKAVEFAEVETVEGEVTSKKSGYIKVDGEKYFYEGATKFDVEYTLYLDPNGVIIALEETKEAKEETEKEYIYVLKAQAEYDAGLEGDLFAADEDESFKAAVKVMNLDGETEVVDYYVYADEKNDDELTFKLFGEKLLAAEDEDALNDLDAGWYAYEMKDDAIVLTEAVEAETITVTDSRTWGKLRVDNKTEVVLLDKDGVYKTYTGRKNMPEDGLTLKNALVIVEDGLVVSVYNYAKKYEKTETETIDVALFVELGEETADGTVATFYVAGEKADYVVDLDASDELEAAKLYEIEIDDDDIATVTALEEGESIIVGKVEYIEDNYFEIDGEGYEMTDDCAVYQLNNAGTKVSNGTLAKKNVIVILDSEGDAVEIFQYKGEALGL